MTTPAAARTGRKRGEVSSPTPQHTIRIRRPSSSRSELARAANTGTSDGRRASGSMAGDLQAHWSELHSYRADPGVGRSHHRSAPLMKAFVRALWFVLPILVMLACAYLAIYMLVQLLWMNR